MRCLLIGSTLAFLMGGCSSANFDISAFGDPSETGATDEGIASSDDATAETVAVAASDSGYSKADSVVLDATETAVLDSSPVKPDTAVDTAPTDSGPIVACEVMGNTGCSSGNRCETTAPSGVVGTHCVACGTTGNCSGPLDKCSIPGTTCAENKGMWSCWSYCRVADPTAIDHYCQSLGRVVAGVEYGVLLPKY